MSNPNKTKRSRATPSKNRYAREQRSKNFTPAYPIGGKVISSNVGTDAQKVYVETPDGGTLGGGGFKLVDDSHVPSDDITKKVHNISNTALKNNQNRSISNMALGNINLPTISPIDTSALRNKYKSQMNEVSNKTKVTVDPRSLDILEDPIGDALDKLDNINTGYIKKQVNKGLITDVERYAEPLGRIDYRGYITPGREPNNTRYTLSDYYWYPENFQFFFDGDHYTTADGMFDLLDPKAIESRSVGNAGSFVNSIRKEYNSFKKAYKKVNDVLNDVQDFFKDPYGEIKQYFGFGKKKKGEDAVQETRYTLLNSVPHIQIVEFQPKQDAELVTSYLMDAYNLIRTITKDFIGAKANDDKEASARLENLGGKISEYVSDAYNRVLSNLGIKRSDNVSSLIESGIFREPNAIYHRLLGGGRFTARYEIPLSHQSTYWNADGNSQWSSRTFQEKVVGQSIANFIAKIPFLGNVTNYDISGRPKFQSDNAGHDSITTTFQLFNYNTNALIKNLKFIHAFTSGQWWLQEGLLQVSPNLYDIHVPGRFRYPFCSMSTEVGYSGKNRRLPKDLIAKIQNEIPKIRNRDVLYFAPDVFEVSVTIQSVMPNNYNMYANYIADRNPTSEVGKEVKTILGTLREQYEKGKDFDSRTRDYLDPIYSKVQGKFNKIEDKVRSATKSKLESATSSIEDYAKSGLERNKNRLKDKLKDLF